MFYKFIYYLVFLYIYVRVWNLGIAINYFTGCVFHSTWAFKDRVVKSKFLFVHFITENLTSICVFIHLKFTYVAEVIILSFCTLMDCLLHTHGLVHLTLETTAIDSIEIVY